MAGQQVGYVRVSTIDQNTARQLDGVPLDKVFTDKLSGKSADRPALTECLAYVREGDTLNVHSLDRLARNLDDLRRIVKELVGRGVIVRFHKESLTFAGDDNPMSVLLLSVMGAFAEFERSLILERQKEGIALAKQKGVYKGRAPSMTPELLEQVKERIAAGEKVAAIARSLDMSRPTIYRHLKPA